LSGRRSSSNKKIIVYAIIGILVVAAFAVTFLARGSTPVEDSADTAIATFKQRFCGDQSSTMSTAYISEVRLPSECQMPLSVAVDGDSVWYVSTKEGTLGKYSLSDGKFTEYQTPQWPSRGLPTDLNMSWAAKVDQQGNVWFLVDNEQIWRFNVSDSTFDSFQTPALDPISFDFDSDGNIYLVGVRSKSLYFGDISQMSPGTSEGFTEIPLPLDAFEGVNPSQISSGSVTVDNERGVVWTSVLAFFARVGQVYRYEISTGEVTAYDLPPELSSPVGMTTDDNGNLWVTDHGTSMFFMLDPADGAITRYVTSAADGRIFGGTVPPAAYTLPYWIESAPDGMLWFNQHTGNQMSAFDVETQTLTEYWVPTQNANWQSCPNDADTCGVANALQFNVGPDGQVWFAEWSENKIGTVKQAQAPLAVSAPDEITVVRGDSAEIRVDIDADGFAGSMVVSGTFTTTGGLGNATGIFSEEQINVNGSKQVSFVLTPAADLAPGQYTLMLGAENDEIAVLKAVRVNVV
jgi:virginiamycin B lyase